MCKKASCNLCVPRRRLICTRDAVRYGSHQFFFVHPSILRINPGQSIQIFSAEGIGKILKGQFHSLFPVGSKRLYQSSAERILKVRRVEIKIPHTGGAKLLLLIRKLFDFGRRKRMSPVEFTAFSSPAQGGGCRRAYKVRMEALVNCIVNIDTIKFTIFGQTMQFPCNTPGASGDLGL